MRVEFSRSKKFYPKFGGNEDAPEAEKFWTILMPLKMGDLIALSDLQPGKDAPVETVRTNIKVITEQSAHLFPKYVTIHNLHDTDGNPLTVEDIITFPTFVPLVAEILSELTKFSQPDELDEKNLKAPAA